MSKVALGTFHKDEVGLEGAIVHAKFFDAFKSEMLERRMWDMAVSSRTSSFDEF